jgi:Na+-driven multidrug efflux pump
MAKPTKYAPHICTVATVLALLGIILGFLFSSPILIVLFLFPTAIYEAYRTEGKSTKAASILLVVILFFQLIFIIFDINFNIAEFLGAQQKQIGGYLVPLGDIKVVGPTVMAILSIILFTKTWGVYTKWLAVVIFITCFAMVYVLDPDVFQHLLKYALDEGLKNIR